MIVIVVGMHRSGTSALSGLLHSNGIVMGREEEFYPPPMKENPKGFYENHRFRVFNDTLLKEYNYRVRNFSYDLPNIKYETKKEAISLIEEYESEFENWGFKDPRTCITLPVWIASLVDLGLIDKTRFIYIYRKPEDVSLSMKTRGNKEREKGQFNKLAQNYSRAGLLHLARYYTAVHSKSIQQPFFILSFDNLIKKTEEVVNQLSDYLDFEIKDLSFVDKKISELVA
jgi:hypothetical protein